MEHIILSRELVSTTGNICCFGILDSIGLPRRTIDNTLSLTFRGKDNFTIRGKCPGHFKSLIKHGDPVLIYAETIRSNGYPFLKVIHLQRPEQGQEHIVLEALEYHGVGDKEKSFGLTPGSQFRQRQGVDL